MATSDEQEKPKLRIVAGGCDIIIQTAASESNFPDSHVLLEAVETLIDSADLSFWEKFDGQVTPAEFFSAVLVRLAWAWKAHAHWDERDPSNLLHVQRTLKEMLEDLENDGSLPKEIQLPRDDDNDDDDELEDESEGRN